jgi:RimJ/RimL family protein N-acetyltransferase
VPVVIETERLRLRPIAVEDVDELLVIHADPGVGRFMPALGRDQTVERLKDDAGDWAERGYGSFAILERGTGRFLGRAGPHYLPEFDETELVWVLRREVWGRGLATEAADACADWTFGHLQIPYLVAMIRSDNQGSIEVARRLGMTRLREDVLGEVPILVYAVRREDWASRGARGTRPMLGEGA